MRTRIENIEYMRAWRASKKIWMLAHLESIWNPNPSNQWLPAKDLALERQRRLRERQRQAARQRKRRYQAEKRLWATLDLKLDEDMAREQMERTTLTIRDALTEVRHLVALLENPRPDLALWNSAIDYRAHKVAWVLGYAENPDGTD